MPTAPDCPDSDVLQAFLLGQLPAPEVDRLAGHVEACARCVARLHALEGRDALVEAMTPKPAAGPEASADLLEEVMVKACRLGTRSASDTHVCGGLLEQVVRAAPDATQEVYDFLAPPEGPGEIGRLGPYRVLKILGVGGMGIVFQAEDARLGRPVALKTMKPVLAVSPSSRRRFLREAQAIASLAHDHIVTVLHVGEDRGIPFLAMPLLQGETLEDRLQRQPVPAAAEVLRVGRQIAEGLTAAHERNVVHRDVKPGNVWLEAGSGRVKILDFGLARAVGAEAHLTQSGVIVGTPAYMAPEQACGSTPDPRGDLFSLGCLLYRMATGRLPFPGENALTVMRSLALHRPKSPRALNPALPPALSGLIVRLLARSPEDRPPSARAVADELAAIERDPAAGGPPARRGRRTALAVAALLGAVSLAGFLLVPRPAPGPDPGRTGDTPPGPGGDGAAALFAPAVALTAGLYPRWVAVGDFNGDGKPDLVVANQNSHSVNVLLGKGDGTFESAVSSAAGEWFATAVTVADFNKDGKPDLVVVNQGSHTVSVLLGRGDGRFRPPVQYRVANGPAYAAAGDFNGDGNPDLAVCTGGGKVCVLLGDGRGLFGEAVTYAAGTDCRHLAVGDFNGDGKPDLAVADFATGTVRILRGNGDGTFQDAVPSGAGESPVFLAVGDFNRDGKPDLAVAGAGGTVSVLLGAGDGTFAKAVPYRAGADPFAVVAGDFDGDGLLDLATSNHGDGTVSVLRGKGDGTFEGAGTFAVGRAPHAPAAADFNGDGRLDLAVPNFGSNTVSLLLNQGAAATPAVFSWDKPLPAGKDPRAVAVGDFNGDGSADLAVAEAGSNTVSVFLGRGDGSFRDRVAYAAGNGPASVAVGDFNRDGSADLVVADSGGDTVSVLLGRGDGTFHQAVAYAVGKKPVGVAVADVNRDGRPDLVVADYDGGTVSVLLGNGDGTFGAAVRVPVGPRAACVVAGDFNGDGRPDLAVAHDFQVGTVSVLLGRGDGTFQAPVKYPVGSMPRGLVVADFNGDGKPDLVAVNWGSYDVNLLAGRGDGTFATPVNIPTGVSPVAAVAGDFDGDGKPDLAVVNSNGHTVVVFPGDGRGGFGPAVPCNVGSHPLAVAAAHLGGGARPDLVVVNSHSDDVSVLLNRPPAARLVVGLPNNTLTLPGQPVTIRVEARDAANKTDTAFSGTVRFTSSDGRAVLPGDCAFEAADRGARAFAVTFAAGGAQRVVVADRDGRLAPGGGVLRVIGPADTHFDVDAPKVVTAGQPFRVTVTAREQFDNPLPGYTGTVRFTATEAAATLPRDYTFTVAEGSEHAFEDGVILRTPGKWTVTVTDTRAPTVTGSVTVTVKSGTGRASGGDP